jgi:Common central domain of tyrosinase/Polyphenol oxidase middle domain
MKLTRRAFARGGAAVAAAAILPARATDIVQVRRSVDALIRDKSPLLDSYRRAVDVMMKRDIADKTSWWFQANVYGLTESSIAGSIRPLAKYWRQCPRWTYFFLGWQRMYLYFFERILRRACGDPIFALPYWAYDDPQQSALPRAFRPSDGDRGRPPSARRNPLARARRLVQIERGALGLSGLATDIRAALLLASFTADSPLDALRSFGGMRTHDPKQAVGAGAIEAIGNRVHLTIGHDGDMGSPTTAARDPVFWLHQANIDRLWVKWTDAARVPPLNDDVWMKTAFTFIDENGDDRMMTGADILDTQHQLGYRYDDDPPRSAPLAMTPPTGVISATPPEAIVLARSRSIKLDARESDLVLMPVPRPRGKRRARRQPNRKRAIRARMHIVFKYVTARDRTPPYDVFLILEGSNVFEATKTSIRIGALELFGGIGRGRDTDEGESIAFNVTGAIASLSKMRGYNIRRLRVSIVRRSFVDESGKPITPPDPSPPTIGAIELVQS